MSDVSVEVKRLSKRFLVLKREKTALQVLKALIKYESFKKDFWVLRDISFNIKKGEKLAIIGKNGSGKTTLLRILTGIYNKTSGDVNIEGSPKALFRFWVGFNIDLSVIDNVYLFGAVHGMERNFLKYKMDEILKMAELNKLQFSPLKDLSAGEMQRLAISIFSQVESDFLIFDESLEFIDLGFAQKCESYFQNLSSSSKTVIMTSHNNPFLKRYCKTALWLDEGRIRMSGGVDEVIDEYERSLHVPNFKFAR